MIRATVKALYNGRENAEEAVAILSEESVLSNYEIDNTGNMLSIRFRTNDPDATPHGVLAQMFDDLNLVDEWTQPWRVWADAEVDEGGAFRG